LGFERGKMDKKKLLKKIRSIVLSIESSAKIYLYGSRIRGTAKPDSDWDLLILQKKEDYRSD